MNAALPRLKQPLLSVRNLHVEVDGKEILRGIDLTVAAGETHAIMGPNGSGKSTLAQVLAGREGYTVTAGEARFHGVELFGMTPEERAWAGLFLAFQYPVDLPGVSNVYLLKAAVNSLRRQRGEPELDALDFLARARQAMARMGMDESFLQRPVNEGFSGGEKKRNEVLQMLLLEPVLAILDETDSGLDIDALQVVAAGVNSLRHPDRALVLVTHYQRLLDHVIPDYVHVLSQGRIVRTGGPELARELEVKGYGWLESPASGMKAETPRRPRRGGKAGVT